MNLTLPQLTSKLGSSKLDMLLGRPQRPLVPHTGTDHFTVLLRPASKRLPNVGCAESAASAGDSKRYPDPPGANSLGQEGSRTGHPDLGKEASRARFSMSPSKVTIQSISSKVHRFFSDSPDCKQNTPITFSSTT